jgi:thioredoxin-related protein
MSCRGAIYVILAGMLAVFAAACGNSGRGRRASASEDARRTVAFPDTEVPGMITSPDERVEYLLNHFWDGFFSLPTGVCDSATVNGVRKDELEGKFGVFSTLLWSAPPKTASDAVTALFRKAETAEIRDTSSNVFDTFTEYARKYFYDPNSPVRNEEFYLPYVKGLSVSPAVPEDMKPAYGYEAEMCSLNRIGEKAADFEFTDLQGRKHRLYDTKADYILLFFSNPGCPNCKEITEMIESSGRTRELEDSGRLAVVNIYIDLEVDKWKEYASEYPKEWISGYDHKYLIRTDQIYNVRAIPSLYLLDGEKRVILKDAPQDKVFEVLDGILAKAE